MKLSILLADDDPACLQLAEAALSAWTDGPPRKIVKVASPPEALAAAAAETFHLALVDLHFGPRPLGFGLLRDLRAMDARMELVVVSGASGLASVREAMRAGASDFLPKGYGPVELRHCVESALERRRWRAIEGRAKGAASGGHFVMVGDSAAMEKLRHELRRYAPGGAAVLIEGETGSGKELAARALHGLGPDPAGPFVAVNCAAVPGNLAESHFFGHERGAFSGADRARSGLLEEADGGTLFLDEVNSLPLELQGKLLRALQEKEVRRVGGAKSISLDFRVLAATNASLEEMVRAGTFREDLYYRLGVLRLKVPPLRERSADLPALAETLAPRRVVSAELLTVLRAYHWPGNVRELRNMLTAADALAGPGEVLGCQHLPEHCLRALAVPREGAVDAEGEALVASEPHDFARAQKEREREFLERAYRAAGRNVSALARVLGADRSHLHQKLVAMGVHSPRGRGQA